MSQWIWNPDLVIRLQWAPSNICWGLPPQRASKNLHHFPRGLCRKYIVIPTSTQDSRCTNLYHGISLVGGLRWSQLPWNILRRDHNLTNILGISTVEHTWNYQPNLYVWSLGSTWLVAMTAKHSTKPAKPRDRSSVDHAPPHPERTFPGEHPGPVKNSEHLN